MVNRKKLSALTGLILSAPLLIAISGMAFYNKPDLGKCRTNNLQIDFEQRIEYTRCANGRQNAKEYNRNILEIELIDLIGEGFVDIILYHHSDKKRERLTRDRDYETARNSFNHGDAIMRRLMNQYPVTTGF